jgi:hypothetical protein
LSVSVFPRIAKRLYLIVFTQFRTQNRGALLLELLYLFVFTQFLTQNRAALLLEPL